ncbi:MAG: MOSC domain-containing protein [Fimbriimonadaceae bacterium]|nr:MOSC domain-containing protein [Fimbriimonadaceae bacterium]
MHLLSVNQGGARPHPRGNGRQTGIYKEPVAVLTVTPVGVAGDVVCDRQHHGMPSKALCCYSGDHYPGWAERYPDGTWAAGTFGENLTVAGLTEDMVHLGDVWQIGAVVLQVSQPRGPCATLAGRVGLPDFVKVCLEVGWTGWYVRVLAPGDLRAGDAVSLRQAHPAAITVREANEVRYAATPHRAGLLRLLAVDALSDEWRRDLSELLARAG